MESSRVAQERAVQGRHVARAPEVELKGIERVYGAYARVYDTLFGRVLEPGRLALAAAVAEEVPGTLLEVGVGTGLTLAHFPATTHVEGIDVSDDMLRRAELRAAAMPERSIRLAHMDAEAMDFPDASFDCVVIPYVLSVTPQPARLVREVRRVCKPGGRILIVNHFSGSRFWWLLERLVAPVAARIGFRSDFGFDEHVARHDWVIERVESVNLFGLSRLVCIRNTPARNSGAAPQSNRTG